MYTAILYASSLLLSSLASTTVGTPHYYGFQLETRRHCIEGLRDAQGRPPACSKSIAMETAGLTLPGMEDGTLTTRSHVIIGSDGSESTVEAHPSYPYQYFLRCSTGKSVTVERLTNAKALFVGSTSSGLDGRPATLSDSTSLEDDGWTFSGNMKKDGVEVSKWVKMSFQGMDNSTGFNYSSMYMANLAPDTWTLYMDDKNEKPLSIIATNGRHGHVVHQEMRLVNFEKKEGLRPSAQARQRFLELYQIHNDGATPSLSAATAMDERDGSFSSMRESLLSGYIPPDPDALTEAVDWMPRRRLRSSQVIPYFTVEDGTAAAVYFNKLGTQRQLITLFNFQYPPSCQNSTNKDKLCLFVKFNAGGLLYSANLNMGITLPDVHNPNRKAQLYLYVALAFNPKKETLALDLSVKASGCAVVWELGEGISLSITVCLTSKGGVKYNNDTLTFAAFIDASISFDVNLPVIGSIINLTILGQLGCTAAPKNTVTAYGKLGVRHSIFIAGASIVFDIVASTVDHLPNKWEFSSGVTFSAWINLIFWWPRWSHRYLIWSVGPVTF